MDHLPCPHSPVHSPIEVPYACVEEYDGGIFETYPVRKGWAGPTGSSENVSGFIQTWLFFGLLTTFFGETINVKDWTFSRENPRRIIITTIVLPQIASRWIDQQRALDEQSSETSSIKIKAALLFVSRLVDSLYSLAGLGALDLRIILSIEMLGEFLQSTSFRAYQTRLAPDWRSHSTDEVNWLNHQNLKKSILYNRLHTDGWCPYEVAMLKTKFPGSGLYFIGNLDRPGSKKNHGKCTEFKCFTYQVDQKAYKTKHVEDHCRCVEVVDNLCLIHSILKDGSVPLVSPYNDEDPAQLHIVEAAPGVDYVAISHVWSDGLGNLQKNALPQCQLRRLSELATNAFQFMGKTSTPLFWVDTICCPPEDGEAQDLAISRMRDTYEKASCVLVLDSWLEGQSSEALNDCEIMMRIACCGWNRRLWTFQEGALAEKLLFKFSDGLFDIDDATARIYYDKDEAFDLTLKTSIIMKVLDARGFRRDMDVILRIKTIMSSLKFRSTSVASDEALCLGVMLNLDVMKIIQSSPKHEERMAVLWGMLSEAPAELAIFDGRRLALEKFRWAPATLLSPINPGWGPVVRYSRGNCGQITPVGLKFRFPGFELSCQNGTIFRVFHFKEEESKVWYEVCCYRIVTSDTALQNEENGEGLSVEGSVRPLRQSHPDSLEKLALITQVPIARPGIPLELRSSGILVSITRKEDGVIFAAYECNVTARRAAVEDESSDFSEWHNRVQKRPLDIYDDLQLMVMSGKKTVEDQVWCVG